MNVKLVEFVAKKLGIYQNKRIRQGETFMAPETLKGKWFCRKEEYNPVKTFGEISKNPKMTFLELMKEKTIKEPVLNENIEVKKSIERFEKAKKEHKPIQDNPQDKEII